MKTVSPFLQRLESAEGYLALGMAAEAIEELDHISPEQRNDHRAMVARVDALRLLADWKSMEATARTLAEQLPGIPFGWLNWADAARREHGLGVARDILQRAKKRVRNDASIEYGLACCECQMGRLAEARKHLDETLRLNKKYRRIAADDPDLSLLQSEGCLSPKTRRKR